MTMRTLADGKGVGSIMAVATLLILSLMAMVVVSVAGKESYSVVNQAQGIQAFALAEAGAHRALTHLSKEGGLCLSFTDVPLAGGAFTTTSTEYHPTSTTLSANIALGDTTIAVASTAGYAPYGRIRIDAEQIDYSGVTATSFTGARRGATNTTAVAHASGTAVNQNQVTISATGVVPSGLGNAKRVVEVAASLPDWTAETPSVTGNLNSVHMLTSTDGWAVGRGGIIVHYDGSSWSTVSSPTNNHLNAVSMLSTTDGWTVGDTGTILRYNGSGWSTVESPACSDLKGVFMLSSSGGWAVGDGGTTIPYDGARWLGNNIPAIKLNSISIVSATDGWAVGDSGTILQYNGVIWVRVPSPVCGAGKDLKSVFMVSATGGWGVGSGGIIVHYDGTSWSAVSSPTNNHLNAVSMLSATDGWAVGDTGTILRYTCTSWSKVTSPTSTPLNGLSFVDPREAWAVGNMGTITRLSALEELLIGWREVY